MKHIAVSLLYATAHTCFTQQVLDLAEDGTATAFRPLLAEEPCTEWWGGAALLSVSSTPPSVLPATLSELAVQICPPETSLAQQPLYVWHISEIDAQTRRIGHGAKLRRILAH